MNGWQKNVRQKNILASKFSCHILVAGQMQELGGRDQSDRRDVKDNYREDKARIFIGKKMEAGKCTV